MSKQRRTDGASTPNVPRIMVKPLPLTIKLGDRTLTPGSDGPPLPGATPIQDLRELGVPKWAAEDTPEAIGKRLETERTEQIATGTDGSRPPEGEREAAVGTNEVNAGVADRRVATERPEPATGQSEEWEPGGEGVKLSAADAIRLNSGDEYATVAKLTEISNDGSTTSSIRSKLRRAQNSADWISRNKQKIPEPGPNSARFRYRIRSVWPYLSP